VRADRHRTELYRCISHDGKRFDLIPSTKHVFPFILLTGFDQKASIKIGENPNLERKKRESSPTTSMKVRRKVAAPLPCFPLGANSRGGKGGDSLGFGQEQRWGGHHAEGREEAAQEEHGSGEVSILLFL
jgi:hypothetical protein